MTRKWIITALALAGIAPAALAAQETPRPPRPPRAPRAATYIFGGNRARIGVLVNRASSAETDKYGAKLDAVTPGGPADRAGLKAGDIVTRFNGTALGGLVAVDDEDSGPGLKLVNLVGDIDPGDTVKVEYRRGSETRSATIVAEGQDGGMFGGRTLTMEAPKMVMPTPAPDVELMLGRSWGDLDLVTLNPDLADYFGTKEGVLVVKAADDSTLPLKGGDVILSIGGRKPTSPSHAMRILRSYDAGESVSIEIMRHQRRQTVSWTVPESGWRRMRLTVPEGEQSLFRMPDAAAMARRMQVESERLRRSMEERQQIEMTHEREMTQQLRRRLDSLRVHLRAGLRSVAI